MEHYKSTLGVATLAVVGLLTAARILHPGNFEHESRGSKPHGQTVTVSMDWADPPRRAPIASVTSAPSRDMQAILSPQPLTPDVVARFVPMADSVTAKSIVKPSRRASSGDDPIGRLIHDLDDGRGSQG